VVSIKQQYDFFLDDDRGDPETEVRLDKLFPMTGTEIAASYEVSPTRDEDISPSEVSFTLAQPIAENAFGRSTRLLDQIVGLETNVASHQIVEAYEDYLATIMIAYYAWHAAYEGLLIGESSYRENLRLLDNIKERAAKSIALPVDVNKTTLLVLAKEETFVELREAYTSSLYLIERAIRYDGLTRLVPAKTDLPGRPEPDFETAFRAFRDEGRTFRILDMLEERSALVVKRDADDLLPSINLLVGIESRGNDYGLEESAELAFAGLSLEWPFPDQVERAEHEVSKIELASSALDTVNTYYDLHANLKSLYEQIERERKLLAIAEEKIRLARSVLEDETKNYSFGKITLNDYIDAVNVVDNNRFSRVRRYAEQRILTVEWLRLMDRLITKANIEERHGSSR